MYAFLALLLVGLAAASPALLGSSARVESRNLDEIYHAALNENGVLKVAWGGDVQTIGDQVTAAFTKRFPGIKLDLTVDLSKYLDSRIDRQHQVTNGAEEFADVAVLQTLQNFGRWKSEGRLMPYKVSEWDDIYPEFVDQDGAYTGYNIFTFGQTVYNPQSLHTIVPTSYPDFLDPNLRGKIALTYPNDDDSILYLFTLITKKYGWQFTRDLLKQDIRWARGTATPSQIIANNNEIAVSFAASSPYVKGVSTQSSTDVYMAWPQTACIFSRTKMPESSKLFMNFLLSDEWQSVFDGKFATRRKFDGQGIFKQSNVEPLGYGKFMSDRTTVEKWRFQFESFIGTPQGPDPLDT
ncbi:periplasmic binding protein-like II [Agrocybe pediades]|nr:periplasmic binding protein-like II [Agrocybe pediades]